jgi:hypothetical protein
MAGNTPLTDFAERHRLRIKRDQDRTWIIPGRFGHLWEDGDRMAVTVFGEHATPRGWGNRRRACLAAGMECVQDGDAEGTLTFDPSDAEQAQAAIRAVGAKRRRTMSPAQREAAMRGLARARETRNLPEERPVSV